MNALKFRRKLLHEWVKHIIVEGNHQRKSFSRKEIGVVRRGVDRTGAFYAGGQGQADGQEGPVRMVGQDPIPGKRMFQLLVNDICAVAQHMGLAMMEALVILAVSSSVGLFCGF